MRNVRNIPNVHWNFRFRITIPGNLKSGSPEYYAYLRRLSSAYFKTGVACRLFDQHYLGQITLDQWVEKTQSYLWEFVENYGWQFF